jgi:hypothetical protein
VKAVSEQPKAMDRVHTKHAVDECNMLNLAGEKRNVNVSLSVKH